jgi:hypothetical protein
MSIDTPPPPPPPPPPDHNEKTPMEKWEAAEDRLMAENIVANRKEAEILRLQGNFEGVQQIEDSIAKLPVSDDIKADPQGYLDSLQDHQNRPPERRDAGVRVDADQARLESTNAPLDSVRDKVIVAESPNDLPPEIQAKLDPKDIKAMVFPVEIHDRVMSGGESFEKFSHYGWNDADQTAERQPLTVPHDPAHPMTWVRDPGEGKEEVFFDAIQGIRQTLTPAGAGQLGRDFAPSDPHESLALAHEFDDNRSPAEARNARYTISFEPGAHVTYIGSTVAPQDSPLENRTGPGELPGGATQKLLLSYDVDGSTITVGPVGGRVQYLDDGSMRFGYRDRPLP